MVQEDGPAALGLDQLDGFKTGGVLDVGDHDDGALARHGLGATAPDAARPARHQGHFSVQPADHANSPNLLCLSAFSSTASPGESQMNGT